MRDLLFVAIFLPMPIICLLRPWLGLLIWAWFNFSYPNSSLWGFASTIPANMIVTLCTLTGWLLARDEPKLPVVDRNNLLFAGFSLITAISMMASLSPDYSAIKTIEYTSIFLFIFLLSTMLRTTERIHAFVWIVAFSIGYYAVRCSAFFIVSGGSYRAEGPTYTQLNDNNHLAVALLLAIPLLNYLRLHSRQHWVRFCVFIVMISSALAVISTFSRGGFIGLVAMLGYFWWKSGRKVSHLILIVGGLTLATTLASEAWVERMETIDSAHEEDESFIGRLEAWEVYWKAALDRPFTGSGPKALEDPEVNIQYRDTISADGKAIAAHSIYFQLMGEEGFIALGLYLALLYTAWANGGWVARRTRDRPELAWAHDLGQMAQCSVVAFAITAAALSLAYFDLLFSLLVMTAALRRLVKVEIAEKTAHTERIAPTEHGRQPLQAQS